MKFMHEDLKPNVSKKYCKVCKHKCTSPFVIILVEKPKNQPQPTGKHKAMAAKKMLTSSLLKWVQGRLESNLGPSPIKGGIFGAGIATPTTAGSPLAMATRIVLIFFAGSVFDRIAHTGALLLFLGDRLGR